MDLPLNLPFGTGSNVPDVVLAGDDTVAQCAVEVHLGDQPETHSLIRSWRNVRSALRDLS